MDREKMIARHYLDTGVLGAYETTEVVWDEIVDGKCAPALRTQWWCSIPDKTRTDRMMNIEGRRFHDIGLMDTPVEPSCETEAILEECELADFSETHLTA